MFARVPRTDELTLASTGTDGTAWEASGVSSNASGVGTTTEAGNVKTRTNFFGASSSEALLVGEGGLEPPRDFSHWHLKPARLPFRHSPE